MQPKQQTENSWKSGKKKRGCRERGRRGRGLGGLTLVAAILVGWVEVVSCFANATRFMLRISEAVSSIVPTCAKKSQDVSPPDAGHRAFFFAEVGRGPISAPANLKASRKNPPLHQSPHNHNHNHSHIHSHNHHVLLHPTQDRRHRHHHPGWVAATCVPETFAGHCEKTGRRNDGFDFGRVFGRQSVPRSSRGTSPRVARLHLLHM